MHIKDKIVQSQGWKRNTLTFLCGLFSVFSLAPFFISPILFLTFPFLVWMLEKPFGMALNTRKIWQSFQDGWWFGFGYFFAGLFWVGEAFLVEAEVFGWLLPFAVLLLPAGLAIFYGAAAILTTSFWRPGLSGLLIMAVLFSSVEWLRGHILTGFPWNILGYALTSNVVMMQAAGIIGIYGLTLWTILFFSSPLVLLEQNLNHKNCIKKKITSFVVVVTPAVLMYFYGVFQIPINDNYEHNRPRVRLVQPSVPQREKWMVEKQGEIFSLHLNLSRQNEEKPNDLSNPFDLIVWPEAAMPFRPLEHPEALEALSALLKGSETILLSGGLRVDFSKAESAQDGAKNIPRLFNSIFAFSSGGDMLGIYDKIHLVPFGEYLPFQKYLELIGFQQLTKIRGGFTSGPNPRPLFKLKGLPTFSGLICYEAIFPGQIVQGSERPEFLINVTNDGWFGETIGPYQHLHQTRVRAVEEGLPILRAANNGISAVIDSYGRIRASLGLNKRGVIDATLPPMNKPPLYAIWGDGIYFLNALLFLALAFVL
ncbi:MAG: apolipoprotein N-acyltransferase [Hyphomicrobium sp.]